MAGITGDATAPYIGAIALVFIVNAGPGVTATVRACEQCIGRRGARMASRAKAARVVVIDIPPGVGKRRAQPIRRRVAGCACGSGDSGRGRVGGEVIRHGPAHRRGALPLSRVAAVTVGRRHGGTGMAEVASHRDMRAGEGETRCAVIEDRARPGNCGVARVASFWIGESHVVGNRSAHGRSALIQGIVAPVASGRQRSGIVTVYVALRAGDSGCMRAGQWEGCGVVIES